MARLYTSIHEDYIPTDGGVCFCCRRRDDGIGALTYERWKKDKLTVKMVYSCNKHIHLLRMAQSMPQKAWDFSEEKAVEEAGFVAGEYLDKIGKTDLSDLEQNEWLLFCKTLIDAFGKDLANRLGSHDDIPF